MTPNFKSFDDNIFLSGLPRGRKKRGAAFEAPKKKNDMCKAKQNGNREKKEEKIKWIKGSP